MFGKITTFGCCGGKSLGSVHIGPAPIRQGSRINHGTGNTVYVEPVRRQGQSFDKVGGQNLGSNATRQGARVVGEVRHNPLISSPMDTPYRAIRSLRGFGDAALDANRQAYEAALAAGKTGPQAGRVQISDAGIGKITDLVGSLVGMLGKKPTEPVYTATPTAPVAQASGIPGWALGVGALLALGAAGFATYEVTKRKNGRKRRHGRRNGPTGGAQLYFGPSDGGAVRENRKRRSKRSKRAKRNGGTQGVSFVGL